MDDVWRKFYLFFEIIVFIVALHPCRSDVLYTSDDPVTILNQNNFKDTIFGQNQIWFVEFYNSWCGTCIRFAPTWKQLGEDVKGWHSVIKMGALDCSVEAHVELCNTHIGSRGYPTLVLFPVHYTDNTVDDQRQFFEGDMDIKELKANMLSFVENHLGNLKAEIRSSLIPLRFVKDIWKSVTDSTVHTLIFFEQDPSNLGLQVVLDFLQYKDLVVRRVGNAEAKQYKLSVLPALCLMFRSGTLKVLASGPDQGQYKEALSGLVGIETDDKGYEGAGDHPVDSEGKSVHKHTGTVVIHMQDLESTLHYSLRQEVTACGDIQGESREALLNYIHVLAKYFPGREAIVNYLWSIYKWLKTQNTPMTGSEWLTSIEKLQTPSAYLPAVVKWQCCEGSSPHYRGYPCGLWSLFHTLTVSAVERQANFPDFDAKDVLTTMKGYITNFFGCRECAVNFQKETSDLSGTPLQSTESILYLWRVHNSVNQRLHGDPTEDPEHLKLPFPTRELCRSCHIDQSDSDKNAWDESEVLSFLTQVYLQNIVQDTGQLSGNSSEGGKKQVRLLNPRDPRMRRDIERFYREKREIADTKDLGLRNLELSMDFQKELVRSKFLSIEKEAYERSSLENRSSWNFSSFDISLCVLFYLICTVFIITLYFNVMIRRRRSVKKQFQEWYS